MKKINLGKFDCSTGLISVLYNDKINDIIVRTSTIKDMLLVDKLQKEIDEVISFSKSKRVELENFMKLKPAKFDKFLKRKFFCGWIYSKNGMGRLCLGR